MTFLFESLKTKKVLVIGDIYLDEMVQGEAGYLSTEGPFPVLTVRDRRTQVSGAGHVATLLGGFGVSVSLFSRIGADPAGELLVNRLNPLGIETTGCLIDPDEPTPTQTRIQVSSDRYPLQELVRLHAPLASALRPSQRRHLIEAIEGGLDECDAVVIFDRDGRFIDADLIAAIQGAVEHRSVVLIGDSEKQISLFREFDLITPNEHEVLSAAPDHTDPIRASQHLQQSLGCRIVLMTQGGSGLTVVEGDAKATHLDTDNRGVFDVTGAGETVLAAGTLGLLLQLAPQEIGELANIAAGLAVSRPGLASLTPQDIERATWLREARVQAEKVVSLDTLRDIVHRAQNTGQRVVWTNGCYDLVHAGHILYLERARELGDILVVGLNSDRSVRLSKGAGRPIVTETQRAKLISSLNVVDYVIVFDDESPRDIIRELKPDIYAKGGDYTVDTINQDERHIVEGYGGEIALLPGVKGMSTTHLIEKILKTYRDD